MSRIEQIRNEILTQLYGYRPNARDAQRMVSLAKRDGELADGVPAEFEREAAYLSGLGLIAETEDPVSPGHKRWTITAAGIQHLERNGLV